MADYYSVTTIDKVINSVVLSPIVSIVSSWGDLRWEEIEENLPLGKYKVKGMFVTHPSWWAQLCELCWQQGDHWLAALRQSESGFSSCLALLWIASHMHETERCRIILQQEKWKPELAVKSPTLFHYKIRNNFNTYVFKLQYIHVQYTTITFQVHCRIP